MSEGVRYLSRAGNVGCKPVLIPDGEELVGGKQNRRQPASSSVARRSTSRCPAWKGQVELPVKGLPCGEAVFRASRGRCRRRASQARCGRKLPQRPKGLREVSYSLHETQCCRQLRTSSPGRARAEGLPTFRSTASSSAFRPVDGQVGAIFLCARGISVWNCWVRRTCLKVPAQDHPSRARRCSTTREISAACPTQRPRGGRACRRPLFEAPSPRPGRPVLRIDTGEVIGSGLFTGTLPRPPVAFRGGTRDPFRAAVPGVPWRASAAATWRR